MFHSDLRRAAGILFAFSVVLAVSSPSPALAQPDAADDPTVTVQDVEPADAAPSARTKEAAPTAIPRAPAEVIRALGWEFTIPFLLASFVAVWFTIERLVMLRRGRVIPKAFVDRFLAHLDQGKLDAGTALQLCEQNGSPVAMVFAHGVRKWGKPSVEVEQAIIDGGERQVSQLRKHLRVINFVSTITPLIGLLGTVVGMILSFDEIAGGAMGNTGRLAHGIAVALLTTAVGLLIAIPALTAYMFLAGRVDTLVSEMDLLAQDVVDLISAEGLNRESAASRAAARRAPTVPTPADVKQKRAV